MPFRLCSKVVREKQTMKRLDCPNKYCLKNEEDILVCSYKEEEICKKFSVLPFFDNLELGIKWLKNECINSDECEYKIGNTCSKLCCRPSWCAWKELEG